MVAQILFKMGMVTLYTQKKREGELGEGTNKQDAGRNLKREGMRIYYSSHKLTTQRRVGFSFQMYFLAIIGN